MRPVAFLDDQPVPHDGSSSDLPIFELDSDLGELACRLGTRRAIIAFSAARDQHLLRLARRCLDLGITLSLVPRMYELESDRTFIRHVGGMSLAELRPSRPDGPRMKMKYALDRVAAATVLLMLSPLLAAVALAVRIGLGRPVLYRQLRLGNDGRRFHMLKFRTMREAAPGEPDADAAWASGEVGGEAAAAAAAESRLTPVGRVLRRYSLDELPQLWNVFVGQMSFIGPRPERVHYAERFETEIYGYRHRHRVKSGLTGWAQVNGLRGRTSLLDRVEWDNHYIEHWTPWLDLKILLLTIPRLLHADANEAGLDAR